MCVVARTRAIPIPASPALRTAARVAVVIAIGPAARSASKSTEATVSVWTAIVGTRFKSPSSINRTYIGIRAIPWESTPRRLAHTSTSATVAACTSDMPARWKTSRVKRVSASAVAMVAAVGAPPRPELIASRVSAGSISRASCARA